MDTKKKILFVLDKWCAGNSQFGVSEWETNLWQSLKSSGLAEYDTFHMDEFYQTNHTAADSALLTKIDTYKPDLICLVIYTLPGKAFNVPTIQTLETIKHEKKVPIFSIWGDLEIGEQIAIAETLEPYVAFNMFTALSTVFDRIKNKSSYAYFWVPKNAEYFYNPNKPRDIDVAYLGSPKPDRMRRVNYLKQNGIEVFHTGGERQKHLTVQEFGKTFMRSKIALSFARAWYTHVTNARTFEVTLCGAMLLEEESIETAKMFTPYVEYVPYTSKKDLLEKCRYYLSHEDERARIAENGYKKAFQYYSAERFWKIVLKKLEQLGKVQQPNGAYVLDSTDDAILNNWGEKTLKLSGEKLSHFSFLKKLKFFLLEYIGTHRYLHQIHIGIKIATDGRLIMFKVTALGYKVLKKILPKRLLQSVEKHKHKFFI